MELTREPYSEPLTLRERVAVTRYGIKHDVRTFWRNGLWERLAQRMPRRLAYFAFVRVMAHAWSDAKHKEPNDITYQEACERWESAG